MKVDIERYLQDLPLPDEPQSLYEPIRYTLSLGGKRVRPHLVLSSCGMCGGDVSKAIHAAAAVEALHNFTLIHDDIMDNAETRRGKTTVHVKWDLPVAILSGDALFAYSCELLSVYAKDEAFSKNQYAQLMETFITSARVVCEGQAHDLEFESRKDVRLGEYLLMIEQKTAALLSAAFKMGGIVSNADAEQLNSLAEIGLKAGLAFQIQDDLLDAIGDPKTFGKKPGGDIFEGKKTYLSILAYELGNDDEKKILQRILQNSDKSDSDVQTVIGIYEKTGAIDKTKQEIERLYNEANELLMKFEENEYRSDITHLLGKLMVRDN